jgi:hypothetical protein
MAASRPVIHVSDGQTEAFVARGGGKELRTVTSSTDPECLSWYGTNAEYLARGVCRKLRAAHPHLHFVVEFVPLRS